MHDKTYCYPDSDVLINKLNITNQKDLKETEERNGNSLVWSVWNADIISIFQLHRIRKCFMPAYFPLIKVIIQRS